MAPGPWGCIASGTRTPADGTIPRLDSEHWPLVAGAVQIAALHALIPDHWMPFILVGRKQNWSTAKILSASALGAVSDAFLSVLLGLAAILAGEEAAHQLGHKLEGFEETGAWLLIGFGLAYATWAYLRSRKSNPHFHLHIHGHAHDGHTHAHDELVMGKATLPALILVAGLSPCFVAVPMFMGTIGHGRAFQLGVIGLYLGVTVLCTAAVSWAALRIHREIQFPFLERHAETISGLVIALTGIALMLLGHDHAHHSH